MARDVEVHCGHRKVSMASLLLVHTLLDKVGDPLSSMLRSMDMKLNDEIRSRIEWIMNGNKFAVMHDYTSRRGCINLEDELFTLGEFLCDDPRDRIYGLLRLIKWPRSPGPPTPDYSVSPTGLAIDVIDRIGRHWSDFHKVHDLMNAIGVELNSAFLESCASRLTRLAAIADIQFLKDDNQFECTCAQPVMSRIALELRTHRFATVYAAPEGHLCATIRTVHDPHEDVNLEQQEEPESGLIISTIRHTYKDKLRLVLVSTVKMQPGDVILHLELTMALQGRTYQNPTFCLVIRSPRQGLYQIVGQAEVHGECSFCFHFAGQKCSHEPCTTYNDFPEGFIFYLDAEDAAAYVLAGREDMGEHRLRNGGSLNGRPPHAVNRRFARSLYSSFALRADVLPTGKYKRRDHMINGMPSLDQHSVICAECGGFFVPAASFESERTV